jgi:hypothetical protein
MNKISLQKILIKGGEIFTKNGDVYGAILGIT